MTLKFTLFVKFENIIILILGEKKLFMDAGKFLLVKMVFSLMSSDGTWEHKH